MGEVNSDNIFIYYCGQESLGRNGVALIVNGRVQNAVLGYSLKDDRMISVNFQGKPFNITVIQVYALTTNAEGAETDWFSTTLSTTTSPRPNQICPLHHRGLEYNSRQSRDTWSNRQVSPWSTK